MIPSSLIKFTQNNHLDNLNHPKSDVTPFSDYPDNHLIDCSPEEAANFASQYVSSHIKWSSVIEKMDEKMPASQVIDIDSRIKKARGNITGYDGEDFTLEKLYEITNNSVRCEAGNCGELCAIGARALMDFGYKEKVEVIIITGNTNDGAKANHAFMLIHGSDGNDSWVADPLTALMKPEQREKFLGDKYIASSVKQRESIDILHLYLDKDGIMTCPELNIAEEEPGIKLFSCYTLEKINGVINLTRVYK
ncbi:hypothetical protein RYZ59_12580 [Citrobacter sp. HN-141]|uniref:hypothetical protein n=1 Tax=unclassified Citrobacter TaxID=2644389 RepID=UPI0029648820|nr:MULTISPECIES: hypothetical protein [unclassified Citrobacter]MDW2644409.1 hypothetical protein [Citrobacter sp. HN-141]MDW2653756.1 hypothetical protein [Citrobacter sp. HN-120]MDW2696781.1 hypothetical protein [Citrobacter sp. HN-144]